MTTTEVAHPAGLRPDVDPAGLCAQRRDRVFAELDRGGIDALVLSGYSNVRFATGASGVLGDASLHHVLPLCAILVAKGRAIHVATPYPHLVPSDATSVVAPFLIETEGGAADLAGFLRGQLSSNARVAFDEFTPAMFLSFPKLLSGFELVDASPVVGAAKILKSDDEIACIDRAQRINELAMYEVLPMLRPGVRQSELSGVFLEAVYRLGATGNVIDPIWEPMPRSIADGPFTPHGDLAFPTPSTDRILAEGDIIYVDTGLDYHGYASDFGRTWLVSWDPRPSPQLQGLFHRWIDVTAAVREACRPGRTGRELVDLAVTVNGGTRPWMKHFYLGHGIGTDSAEMPLIGTDLGDEFDESIVLAAGMTIVLEAATWDDGIGGYRAEEIVTVTPDGGRVLGSNSFPYWPFA